MQSLRESLTQRVEAELNDIRESKETVALRLEQCQQELDSLSEKETEARAMLQLIKTGKVSVPQNGRLILKREDVEAIYDDLPDEFTTEDLSEYLNTSRNAAARWGKVLEDEGKTTRIVMGRGPNPSKWRKN